MIRIVFPCWEGDFANPSSDLPPSSVLPLQRTIKSRVFIVFLTWPRDLRISVAMLFATVSFPIMSLRTARISFTS